MKNTKQTAKHTAKFFIGGIDKKIIKRDYPDAKFIFKPFGWLFSTASAERVNAMYHEVIKAPSGVFTFEGSGVL